VGSLIALMVAEGEDWKSVETPDEKGVAPTALNSQEEESEESEQTTGGNSTVIYVLKINLNTLNFCFFSPRN